MGTHAINFSEVEDSFEPLPEGQYPVTVEKVEVRESKSSEHNYLNWTLKVDEDAEEGAGRNLWMITSLSPKALFKLKAVFENLGVLEDEMDLEWDDDVEVTTSEGPMLLEPDVIGLAATAIVTNEMYEGKEQNRVNDLLESDAGARPSKTGAKASGSKSAAKKPAARRKALR